MIYTGQVPLDLNAEISVDLFAGGGGASSGYERATGRQIDVAVNHDAAAVAMHRLNHPRTRHLRSDVFEVDPREVTGGRPVGLLWASPDCTYHSKARGGKPIRSKTKKRRALAWVVTRWAGQVRPRVIMLENVEEFANWGPLVGPPDALRPCPRRRGRTFRRWVRSLTDLGYQVEWRELRACDYGAPTIRKRLFLIARCDGRPIVWPEPTHGPGRAQPYRTAAECIDWSIPMLSIFATREEARAWGKAHHQAPPVRPLAEATQRRIARGVMRYVVQNPRPFIVPVQNGSNGAVHDGGEPLRTITAHPKGGGLAVAAPVLIPNNTNNAPQLVEDPASTITGGGRMILAAAGLVPRYGVREGQEPRIRSVEEPAPVIVPTGNGGSLAAAMLSPYHAERRAGEARGAELDGPAPTVDTSNRHALVTGFIAKHFGDTGQRPGSELSEPVSTVTASDHNALVAGSLAKLRGTSTDADPREPLHTVSAGGTHHAAVAAFLQKYYGAEVGQDQAMAEPLDTVPTRDRFGLVTVTLNGEPYALVDIAMRMLQPHELYRAQGFRPGYVIDRGLDERGREVRLTKTEQVRMCGNSVSPDVAAALIGVNAPELTAWERAVEKKKRAPRARPVVAAVA